MNKTALDKIQKRIDALESLKNVIANVDENFVHEILSDLLGSGNGAHHNSFSKPAANASADMEEDGNSKKILDIIEKGDHAVTKATISSLFQQQEGVSEEDAKIQVTNALSYLLKRNKVVNFKPKGVKIMGKVWALPTWMIGNKIQDTHKYIQEGAVIEE